MFVYTGHGCFECSVKTNCDLKNWFDYSIKTDSEIEISNINNIWSPHNKKKNTLHVGA